MRAFSILLLLSVLLALSIAGSASAGRVSGEVVVQKAPGKGAYLGHDSADLAISEAEMGRKRPIILENGLFMLRLAGDSWARRLVMAGQR
jgi:hypothetical protein